MEPALKNTEGRALLKGPFQMCRCVGAVLDGKSPGAGSEPDVSNNPSWSQTAAVLVRFYYQNDSGLHCLGFSSLSTV